MDTAFTELGLPKDDPGLVDLMVDRLELQRSLGMTVNPREAAAKIAEDLRGVPPDLLQKKFPVLAELLAQKRVENVKKKRSRKKKVAAKVKTTPAEKKEPVRYTSIDQILDPEFRDL
jgi:hypothetical protein